MTLFEELDEMKNGSNPDIPDGWVRVVEATHENLEALGSKANAGIAPQVTEELGFDFVIVDGIYWVHPGTAKTIASVMVHGDQVTK